MNKNSYLLIILLFLSIGWILFLWQAYKIQPTLQKEIRNLTKDNEKLDNEIKFIKSERERLALSALDTEKILIDKIVVDQQNREKLFDEAKKDIFSTHGVKENLIKLCEKHSGFSFCD